jgi:hypothetical protein
MNIVKQYPDLTEVNGLRYWGSQAESALKVLIKLEEKITTPYAFTDVKTCYPESIYLMDKAPGWAPIRRTLDWHDWHAGDTEVRLYVKHFPNNKSQGLDNERQGRPTYPCHHSLSGSCSMGLVNRVKDLFVSENYPERYLTLLRMVKKPTVKERKILKTFRYTKAFTTDTAVYYVNGWKFDEWVGSEAAAAEYNWWKAQNELTTKAAKAARESLNR